MGTLTHGNLSVDFEDRVLAHLQIVLVQKFRRNESVLVSWLDPLSVGDGRSSIWMSPHQTTYFKFVGSRSPAINEDWLRALHASANSSTGLVVTAESGELARATGAVRQSLS